MEFSAGGLPSKPYQTPQGRRAGLTARLLPGTSQVEIQLVFERVRHGADRFNLLFLDLDPLTQQVVGEDVLPLQELVVERERI
jgi:hypothetical protein